MIKPRALHMLGNHFTELHSQLTILLLKQQASLFQLHQEKEPWTGRLLCFTKLSEKFPRLLWTKKAREKAMHSHLPEKVPLTQFHFSSRFTPHYEHCTWHTTTSPYALSVERRGSALPQQESESTLKRDWRPLEFWLYPLPDKLLHFGLLYQGSKHTDSTGMESAHRFNQLTVTVNITLGCFCTLKITQGVLG